MYATCLLQDGQRRTRPVLGFLGGLLDESTSNKDNFMAFQRLSVSPPAQHLVGGSQLQLLCSFHRLGRQRTTATVTCGESTAVPVCRLRA
jgi:hypothetical protein